MDRFEVTVRPRTDSVSRDPALSSTPTGPVALSSTPVGPVALSSTPGGPVGLSSTSTRELSPLSGR